MITELKLKYMGKTPRTFERPIPFKSMSEKDGEIVCDPIGTFPVDEGRYLLSLGSNMFELIEEVDDGRPDVEETGEPMEMPLCACNCGTRLVWKKAYKYVDKLPRYIQGHHMPKGTIPA